MQMVAMFTGWGEYVVIIGAILMMFGAKKVPEIARSVGRVIHEVRRASNEFRDQIMTADLDVDVDVPDPSAHSYDYSDEHDHYHDPDHDHHYHPDGDHDHHYHHEDDHDGHGDPNSHYEDHGLAETVSQGDVIDVDAAMDVAEAVVENVDPTPAGPVEDSIDLDESGAEKKADGEA